MDNSEEKRTVFDLQYCPKCEGGSGFTYQLTIVGEQYQPWYGALEFEPQFTDSVSKHGAYRCVDCGKIIKV